MFLSEITKGNNLLNKIALIKSKNFLLFLRLLMGVVFIASGMSKIISPGDFGKIIYSYNLVSKEWVVMLSLIIPYTELSLGLMLILNLHVRLAGAVLIFMLVLFTGVSAYQYALGKVNDCGCFGKLLKRQNDWKLILENSVMLVILGCMLFLENKKGQKK